MNKMTIATSSPNNGRFFADYKLLYFYTLLCATLCIFILMKLFFCWMLNNLSTPCFKPGTFAWVARHILAWFVLPPCKLHNLATVEKACRANLSIFTPAGRYIRSLVCFTLKLGAANANITRAIFRGAEVVSLKDRLDFRRSLVSGLHSPRRTVGQVSGKACLWRKCIIKILAALLVVRNVICGQSCFFIGGPTWRLRLVTFVRVPFSARLLLILAFQPISSHYCYGRALYAVIYRRVR